MRYFILCLFSLLLQASSFGALPTRQRSIGSPRSSLDMKRVVIAGATGYIGKYVVKESLRRGYDTVAIVRPGSKSKDDFFEGAEVITADVCDEASIRDLAFTKPTDVIVSCLASRSGTKSDSYKIDYQATLNCLQAARDAKVGHFILLSAYCVKKPLLQFQKAKLEFEDKLVNAGDIKYSIVRPTAFFKSVSGQLELLQQGWPFVMFGDGQICKCNPIAEQDLAAYMLNCIDDSSKWNQILDLGGPDEGMTMLEQGNMIFDIVEKPPSFIKAPIGIFDAVINTLAWFGQWFEGAEDAAELGRIGKYYAVEDMLTTEPSEKFGTVTLREHYKRIAVEGQEYDPYTTMFAPSEKKEE
jgi:divinyl chlorophyllide a 8-vinyl-reductase